MHLLRISELSIKFLVESDLLRLHLYITTINQMTILGLIIELGLTLKLVF